MKIPKTLAAALWLLFVSLQGLGIRAQQSTILDNFTVLKNHGNVYLKWIISSGSLCDGTKIYRSVDQIHFTQIGEILGLCGDTEFPTAYEFIDEIPIYNQRNYYRLELGRSGFSEILSIEIIDFEGRGYQVRPNPMDYEGQVYFYSDQQNQHQCMLYNLNGALVYSTHSDADYFNIPASDLPSGLYIFIISGAGKTSLTKGKLMIQH